MTSWRMPSEWEPHECTWMAFPPTNETFGAHGSASLQRARQAWANVAAAVCGYEPVRMLVRPEDIAVARTLLPEAVELHAVPSTTPGCGTPAPPSCGTRAARWQPWTGCSTAGEPNPGPPGRRTNGSGSRSPSLAGVPRIASTLVNEGGGLHVDGRGTVLLTQTVQQDPGRNPGWSQQQIEAEIHQRLGTHHAVWLPRASPATMTSSGLAGMSTSSPASPRQVRSCCTPSGTAATLTIR